MKNLFASVYKVIVANKIISIIIVGVLVVGAVTAVVVYNNSKQDVGSSSQESSVDVAKDEVVAGEESEAESAVEVEQIESTPTVAPTSLPVSGPEAVVMEEAATGPTREEICAEVNAQFEPRFQSVSATDLPALQQEYQSAMKSSGCW